ncbi:hypothetical protein E2R62_01430 [Citrobacter rodentium]|uniref:Uncharacterized protein n=1 Tax=Citrobacter rodentium TaxID=67825 RepID=A0A482PD93_CITRO|nr:hypothetical protein E2R62_01430 [Citrobacter rodentium]
MSAFALRCVNFPSGASFRQQRRPVSLPFSPFFLSTIDLIRVTSAGVALIIKAVAFMRVN